jgi:integrase
MLTTLANAVRPEIEHQPEAATVDVTPPKLTFTVMLDEWFGESNVPEDRQRHIRTIFDKFAAMLGHDDATRVDTPAVNNFKKLLLATPNVRNGKKKLSKNTVKQTLSPIKTAYQFAVNNGLGGLTVNPARTITVEGVVVGTRDDFTKEEERTILTAARDQRNEIRWFTWLMATVGCSNKEAVCATRDDFSREGDLLIWDIKGTKSDYRARAIPLHSALIAEGFGDWLNTLQPTQALFSELRIAEKTNDWIKSLGISKTVYSFRHGMKTKLRSAMMPSDERNYYQGHAAADVAATYGTNLTTTLAVYIERIPAPLSALRADRAGAL